MRKSTTELEVMFDAAVPLLFQRQWLELIHNCYTEADSARNAYGLLQPVAEWHLPYLRRSLIESHTAELAKRFPSLQVELRRTKVSAVPYLAIKAGPFVITESKVDEPGQLPRDADFRTENSAVNYSLFGEENNTTDPLYVILATVPHASEPRPRYAKFIFPDSDYSTIVHTIDLLGRFDAGAGQTATSETPKVDPTPKLRKPDLGKGEAQGMIAGTPGFHGERLREAREARGLTAIQLAELIGVTKQAVSRYEKSLCSPSPEVLERLTQVLQVPTRRFLCPIPPQPTGPIFYRSMAAATQRMRTRAEGKMDWVRDILSFIRDYIDLPGVGIPDLQFPADPYKLTDEMVDEAAVAVRRHWQLGEGVIANVTLLLENHGAVASRFELESDKLDSFSVWDDYAGRPLLILGADKQSAARSRYDAAHELGHLVMHRNVPRRLLKDKPTLAIVEEQAHRFARAFLLPARSFSRDFVLPTLNALKSLKPKWKASIALMIKRSEELGLISESQARRLWVNRTRQGWQRREPFDDETEPEWPVLLSRSIQLLIESNTLQAEEITNGIGLYAADVEALACLPAGYLTRRDEPASNPEPRLLKFPTEKAGS